MLGGSCCCFRRKWLRLGKALVHVSRFEIAAPPGLLVQCQQFDGVRNEQCMSLVHVSGLGTEFDKIRRLSTRILDAKQ